MVMNVVVAGTHMVSVVPHRVDQSGIVCVVLHNLVMRNLVATSVLVVSICQLKHAFDIPTSQWSVTLFCGNRRSHVAVNHGVVP